MIFSYKSNQSLRSIPIILFCFILTQCLVLGKYPERPKPIENAEKLKVCASVPSKIKLDLKYFDISECHSTEKEGSANFEVIYEDSVKRTWESSMLNFIFLISLGLIPTAEMLEYKHIYKIKYRHKEREEIISIPISKDYYYWLPLVPWSIVYNLKNEENKYEVKTYSELVYNKFKPFHDTVEKEEKEYADNQKYFLENLFKNIQRNIPEKNIHNLDYLACSKNSDNCQNTYDFDMAYFNDKENKIFNSTTYKEDQFTFKTDKIKFKEIRDKKYILINTSLDSNIEFLDYDFNKKGYNFKFSITENIGKAPFSSSKGFDYSPTNSEKFFFKISEKDAQEINQYYKQALILAEIKNVVEDKLVPYKCTTDGGALLGKVTIYANKKEYEDVFRSKYEFSCKPETVKVKRISLEIKKFYFYNEDNADIIEG